MTHTNGLEIQMPNGPTANTYLGFDTTHQTTSDNTVVKYSDPYTASPTKLVKSGQTVTQSLANVGFNRLKTIMTKSYPLKTYLVENGFVNS
jgi:hypothetical protein